MGLFFGFRENFSEDFYTRRVKSGYPILNVDSLQKQFGKQSPTLQGVSISIAEGESVALVGANGAGKSTFIKILLGQVQKTSGQVELFGQEPGHRDALKRVGYLPEMSGFWDELSARELLGFLGKVRGMPALKTQSRLEKLLSMLGLKIRGSRHMGGYSKGMLQRTCIASARLHDPELIILDEPMSGLDPRAQEKFKSIILKLKEAGKTILMSSHALEDIRLLCDRVIVLEKSKVVADGPAKQVIEELKEKYHSSEPWDEDPLGEVPEKWEM